MKKIFIKDDRLREIHSDLSDKIVKMLLNGKLKGSYTVKEASKEFETKDFPGSVNNFSPKIQLPHLWFVERQLKEL